MRPLFSLLALVLACPLVGCGKHEFKNFSEYTPPEGDYTVLMPGQPYREVQHIDVLTLVVDGIERRGEGYAVASATIPPHESFDIDSGVEHLARKVNGTYKIDGGDRGYWRNFEIEGQKPRTCIAGRALCANGRFYIIYALGADARLSNPQIQKFVASFRLTFGDTPGVGSGQAGALNGVATPDAPALPPAQPPAAPTPPTPSPTPPAPSPARDTIVSMTADPTFRDDAPSGGLLVGIDVWYGTYANYDIISAVRPIYRTNGIGSSGRLHGTESARGARTLAKTGYAVGTVEVRYGAAIDSLTVTYMKIVDGRLDSNDTYTEKVGGPGGYGPQTVGNGTPVVGIRGRKGTNVTGFGLALAGEK